MTDIGDVGHILSFVLGSGVRVGLAAMFLFAGFQKLNSHREFAQAVSDYGLLSTSWVRTTSLVVPVTEVAIGIGMLIPQSYQVATACGIFLVAAFLIAMAVALMRGQEIECGCRLLPGSPSGKPLSSTHLLRNLVLMTALGAVLGFGQADLEGFRAGDHIVSVLLVGASMLLTRTITTLRGEIWTHQLSSSLDPTTPLQS